MSYQDRLEAHLADYKRATLKISEPGIFNYHGTDVRRDHILPTEHADLNLMPAARPLEASIKGGARRHRYFHHLNSSQAFTFNLFLPYFSRGGDAASALLRALGQSGTLRSWQLEAVPDRNEGTNIDALWVRDDGATTFCEVKLSEAEFGTAEDDERHQGKYRDTYHPVLRDHTDPHLHEPTNFFASYQILRNVWHMVKLEGSSLLFLLPRANEGLWAALPKTLALLAETTRSRIQVLAIEDVIARLESDDRCPDDLRAYASELSQKYVPE